MNSTTMQLLNRVRETTETRSDYAVAMALGISRSRMSKYVNGHDELQDDEIIARAAELLGDDPAALLARFHAERAKIPAVRNHWLRLESLARQHAPATALAVLLTTGVTLAPSPAQAFNQGLAFQPNGGSDAVYYVK